MSSAGSCPARYRFAADMALPEIMPLRLGTGAAGAHGKPAPAGVLAVIQKQPTAAIVGTAARFARGPARRSPADHSTGASSGGMPGAVSANSHRGACRFRRNRERAGTAASISLNPGSGPIGKTSPAATAANRSWIASRSVTAPAKDWSALAYKRAAAALHHVRRYAAGLARPGQQFLESVQRFGRQRAAPPVQRVGIREAEIVGRRRDRLISALQRGQTPVSAQR
jgi:hypothetical protein